MKFKKGDRIKVPGGDLLNYCHATIVDTGKDLDGGDVYLVCWDHRNGQTFDYKATDVDYIWENDFSKAMKLPTGIDFIPFIVSIEGEKTSCSHDWVEYNGFTEVYKYCKKCDEKRRND